MNSVSSIDPRDLELLRSVAVNGGSSPGTIVEVVVNGCAYSCCGRGWQRKDGYEQTYRGYIDNFREPDPSGRYEQVRAGEREGGVGTFMLYSVGVGTLSYVIAATFPELLDVQLVDP